MSPVGRSLTLEPAKEPKVRPKGGRFGLSKAEVAPFGKEKYLGMKLYLQRWAAGQQAWSVPLVPGVVDFNDRVSTIPAFR